METYIVHIYRQSGAPGEDLVGVVEQVGLEHQVSFRNLEELGKLLKGASEQGRTSSRRRRKTPEPEPGRPSPARAMNDGGSDIL